MERLRTVFLLMTAIVATSGVWAVEGVPSTAGEPCRFVEGVRYSHLIINTRINDFKANTTNAGFGVFDAEGNKVEQARDAKITLDYVPGLVAKAILEAVDYYKDRQDVDVAPWFYAIQDYGMSRDITSNGKNGKSFDDLNAVKLYFLLSQLAASDRFNKGGYTKSATLDVAQQRFADALAGIAAANAKYVIRETTLPGAAGGWWHKSSYVDQMWCDGQYMGPALLAQLLCNYAAYQPISNDDWHLLTEQFRIAWHYLWDDDQKLLYHAFTADPAGSAASKWKGVSAEKGAEVYHSAEFWGRAVAWYFMALVDVLEQMNVAGLQATSDYQLLRGYLQQLGQGIAARQDEASGCWYQLLAHDGSFVANSYNSNYSYTTKPVANYLESSCTSIFTAAFLKGMRLGLFDTDFTPVARKAFRGIVEHFMVADGKGGVHIIGCCKSAGLGGSNYRDGSAEYYLMGKDTKPTSTQSSDFYTEGKVLGGFIMAATEYERLDDVVATTLPSSTAIINKDMLDYDLQGRRLSSTFLHGIYLKGDKKVLKR